MNKTILHIDFNSYFATIEQQANPRLRGKPIGVTGGDRMKRTVLGAASVEAKRYGVKTGMMLWEAQKLCPQIILVPGDSDKYLECSKKFWNILKNYSPTIEIFSIDEVFLELNDENIEPIQTAQQIKQKIKSGIGEWVTCSIGISYNKLMAKLASSLKKPDGLVVISNQEEAIYVLDRVKLDDICGIGPRIKKRLFNLGIYDFKTLRQVPKELLLASFKSYGEVLYNMSRGIHESPITAFYEKEEVKSIGHRHTINHDTSNPEEIKQILLKLCEMIACRARTKKLVGKTVTCWYRLAFKNFSQEGYPEFEGGGAQKTTLSYTYDGLDIFNTAWEVFNNMWEGKPIRMIGVSISNLKPNNPYNLSLLPEEKRRQIIISTIDKVNHKFGDFTLKRGVLLGSTNMRRKPNPYLADRRFRL